MVIKTEENDTMFDFKNNPLTFKFKTKTYDVQNLLDKIHDRPSHKEVDFNKEVLVMKKTDDRIKIVGNTVTIYKLDDLIRNTQWVGKTLQFEFVYCGGKESSLHGNEYKYHLYNLTCFADKLPTLGTSTWTKVYPMDHYVC